MDWTGYERGMEIVVLLERSFGVQNTHDLKLFPESSGTIFSVGRSTTSLSEAM
jgi:hypothetical protein